MDAVFYSVMPPPPLPLVDVVPRRVKAMLILPFFPADVLPSILPAVRIYIFQAHYTQRRVVFRHRFSRLLPRVALMPFLLWRNTRRRHRTGVLFLRLPLHVVLPAAAVPEPPVCELIRHRRRILFSPHFRMRFPLLVPLFLLSHRTLPLEKVQNRLFLVGE